MRFTIDKEQFLKGLLIAGRGIGAKNANPLLLCFKMEMTSIGLEITASNGDVTVFTRVPLKLNEKEIIRNYSLGSSLITARSLTEIVRKMEGDELSLDIIDESVAKVDDGNTTFKLPCAPADEYPDIDLEKTGPVFSIPCTDFTKIIEQTAFAALDKDTRPILTAINLKAEGGLFTATATDSFRAFIQGCYSPMFLMASMSSSFSFSKSSVSYAARATITISTGRLRSKP